MAETRQCGSCKGVGRRTFDGKDYGLCLTCNGAKELSAPDVNTIIAAIKGRNGLRSKAPDFRGSNWSIHNLRAYYVWRLARFHGGADVTLPVTATTLVHGDPFQPELEKLAEMVAQRVYGTDIAAAYRWAGALGNSVTVPTGLPSSAYSGGPVLLDNNKPEEELLELY